VRAKRGVPGSGPRRWTGDDLRLQTSHRLRLRWYPTRRDHHWRERARHQGRARPD
jgi:hypothetical protein